MTPLSRRDFLRTGVAATGAAVFAPWHLLPPAYVQPSLPARPAADTSRRVLVLGAGLAGLAAAWELKRAGHDVTVLEARSRPGGRVHTLRQPFAGALYAEAGAMFAGGPHVVRYADELGIEFSGIAGQGDWAFWVGGERFRLGPGAEPEWPVELTAAERRMGLSGMRRKYVMEGLEEIGNPLDPSWPPERIRHLDDMSFDAYLASRGASPGAISLLRLDVLDLYGQGFESMSALAFLRDWAARPFMEGPGRGGVIDGGTDRFPEAFAARLPDRIRYGTAVERIAQDSGGVRVTCRSGGETRSLTADRVVCTIPFPVLRTIEISPELPEDKRRAIETLPYSTISRVYVQMRERYWEDDGFVGAGYGDTPVARTLVHPLARKTERAILEAHTGRETGSRVAAMSDEERLAFALEHLEAIHPGAREHAEGGTSYCWPNDPWTRGAYSSFAPGQIFAFLPVIARPEGRIHFAGEHTSRLSASMDGALASGARAAQEIDRAAD